MATTTRAEVISDKILQAEITFCKAIAEMHETALRNVQKTLQELSAEKGRRDMLKDLQSANGHL